MYNGKKLVMCGCHEVGLNAIKSLLEEGIEIDQFVTITEEKAIQQKVSGYVSFEDLAKKYNIPIHYVNKYSMKDDEDIAFFEDSNFDLLIQGGWQRLFPDRVIASLSIGAVGVHGSSEFLPKGRGRSPINWSLIEGKKRFILHFFLMKPGVDDGDVFHFEIFDINQWDDCRTLYLKNALITKNVLKEYIPKLLKGEYTLIPQTGEPTYYPKRTKEDGLVDWSKTVFEIYDFIRALTKPYPGAFSFINDNEIVIWSAQPFDTRIAMPSVQEGQVVEVFSDYEFVVNCNSGLLLITDYDYPFQIKKGDIFLNQNVKINES